MAKKQSKSSAKKRLKDRQKSAEQKRLERRYSAQRARITRQRHEAEAKGAIFIDDPIPPRPKKISEGSIRRLQRINAYDKAQYASNYTGELISADKYQKEKRSIELQEMEMRRENDNQKERLKSVEKEAERLRALIEQEKAEQRINTDVNANTSYYDESDASIYSHTPANESDEVLTAIEEMIDNFEPSYGWSNELAKIKKSEVGRLRLILQNSIERESRDKIARKLQEQSSEITEIVNEALYKSSGGSWKDFIDARNTADGDINKFARILNGHALTKDESEAITDQMRRNDFDAFDHNEVNKYRARNNAGGRQY